MNRHNIVKVFLAVALVLILTGSVFGQTVTEADLTFSEWLATEYPEAVTTDLPLLERFGLVIRELPDYFSRFQSELDQLRASGNIDLDTLHDTELIGPELPPEYANSEFYTSSWFNRLNEMLQNAREKIASTAEMESPLLTLPDALQHAFDNIEMAIE